MKRSILALALAASMSTAIAGGLATGGPTGKYFLMGNQMKNACPNVPMNVYESAGGVSNLERIFSDPQVQYGLIPQDTLVYMNMENPNMMAKIMQVFPLYSEEIQILVNTSKGIRSLNDLAGKKVVIGKQGSGNWVTSNIIQSKTGIQWRSIEDAPADSMISLVTGDVDAVIVVAGKPVPYLTSLGAAAKGKVSLLNVQHRDLDGFYQPGRVPEGLYSWQTTGIQTYSVKTILAVFNYKNPKMQQEIVDLTKCLVRKLDDLQASGDPKWREVDPLSIEQVKWPIHPAALQVIKAEAKRR